MKKSYGILVEPGKREGRTFINDVKEKVLELYLSDEFSQMCLGKKRNSFLWVLMGKGSTSNKGCSFLIKATS